MNSAVPVRPPRGISTETLVLLLNEHNLREIETSIIPNTSHFVSQSRDRACDCVFYPFPNLVVPKRVYVLSESGKE